MKAEEFEKLKKLEELAKKNEMRIEDYDELANQHEQLIKEAEELAKKHLTKKDIAKAIDIITKGIMLIYINAVSVPDLMSACSGPTYHDAYIGMIIEEAKALKKLADALDKIDL